MERFYCKTCKLSQQKAYKYKAYNKNTNYAIYKLVINSCGITDISRVLNISKNTVSSRILNMGKLVPKPILNETCQSYEVDELHTKANKEKCCITYAINRKTKQVVDFLLGNLTKENLAKVINSLRL